MVKAIKYYTINVVLVFTITFLFISCNNKRLNEDELIIYENFEPTTTPLNILNESDISDFCFYENNFVKLVANQSYINDIIWYHNEKDNFNQIGNSLEYSVSESGEYKAEISFNDEMEKSDSTIYFNLNYCKTSVEIPDIFLPQSGQVSTWRPIGKGILKWEITITNENDVTVYKSNSFVNANWDGKYNGQRAKPGTYQVQISGVYRSGYLFEKNGSFELSW